MRLSSKNGYLLHNTSAAKLSHMCGDSEVTPGAACNGVAMPQMVSVAIGGATQCPGPRICEVCANGSINACRQCTVAIPWSCNGGSQPALGPCVYYGDHCVTCQGLTFLVSTQVQFNPTTGFVRVDAGAVVVFTYGNETPPAPYCSGPINTRSRTSLGWSYQRIGAQTDIAGLASGGSVSVPVIGGGACGSVFFSAAGSSASVTGGP